MRDWGPKGPKGPWEPVGPDGPVGPVTISVIKLKLILSQNKKKILNALKKLIENL